MAAQALAVALALVPALALTGCESVDPVVGGVAPSWKTTLTLQDAAKAATTDFGSGEPIEFALTVRNQTDTYQALHFVTTQRFEFVVSDLAGNEVWRWSDGLVFERQRGRIDLRGHESRTFRPDEPWDQRRSDGTLVPAGDYRARGWLTVEGLPLEAAPQTFTIR